MRENNQPTISSQLLAGDMNCAVMMGHYIICNIGVLVISYKLGLILGEIVASQINSSLHYYEWTKTVLENKKPEELFGYLLPMTCLFFYYGFVYLHFSMQHSNKFFLKYVNTFAKIGIYFLILLSINMDLLYGLIESPNLDGTVLTIVWSVLFLLPVVSDYFLGPPLASFKKKADVPRLHLKLPILLQNLFHSMDRILTSKLARIVGVILLIGIVAQLWWTFIPYLTTVPHIHNDYLSIPEQTKSDSGYIDNLNYVNQHRLGGFLQYDPRLFQHPPKLKAGEDYIPLVESNELIKYVLDHSDKYTYDVKYHGLFVEGLFSEQNKAELCQAISPSLQCERINQFYSFITSESKRQYTKEEINYIQKNMYELGNQLQIGHYFLHQAFFLGPINEYNLGRPQAQILFLYGWLNAVMFAGIFKLAAGGLSFASYIKWTYLFYPLYYTLIVLAAQIIFRNIWSAFVVGLICITGLFSISFEAIYMAPGFNPVRHFLDIFVLVSFYYYLFSKKNRSIFLGTSLFFSILAYLCNREFGLFIIAGLALALFVNFFKERRIKFVDLFLIFLWLLAILVPLFLVKTAIDPLKPYYFLGFLAPQASIGTIWSCLLLLSIVYVLLIFFNWRDPRWKILLLYLFGYGQLSLIYYIWNPSSTHFYSIMFSWAFIGVIIFQETFNSNFFKVLKRLITILAIPTFFILSYNPAVYAYYRDQLTNQNVFKDHKLYYWSLPTAQFLSSMDPRPFVNAVNLINKYSKDNGIYIISRYDNLLPFLAKKYSLMPCAQTAFCLVTVKEMQITTSTILQNKPEYLFVDTHITDNHRGEISRINDPALSVYNLSRSRFLIFDANLSYLFNTVSKDYVLVELGQLISVYKHKS